MPEPRSIRKLYEAADQLGNMPEGKGMNTMAFHRCVIRHLNRGKGYSEAARLCMRELGRDKAVNKSHWDKDYREPHR